MNLTDLSKEVSYALRHAPWEYGLELDEQGFVSIEQLLRAINKGGNYCRPIVRNDLEQIIEKADKKRHEIVGDCIRARYGHSLPNRIYKKTACPPKLLYHGTTRRAVPSIMKSGLKPMNRQYVHLSVDVNAAYCVGARRDKTPIVFVVNSESAYKNGITFYEGNDMVWLANEIPVQYLSKLDEIS